MASSTLILIGGIHDEKMLIFEQEKNDEKKIFRQGQKNCV